jgi:hypothetical protein
MNKARLALNSAVVFGAGLCWLPGLSCAATTYSHTVVNKPFGEPYNSLSGVVVTTGYENIQSGSTNVPADAVSAPAIFFELQINPGPTGNPGNVATDITQNTMWWCDYDIGLETSPGAGSTAVMNPYGNPIGISTGWNYFIAGFNNKVTAPSTAGGNQVYNYSAGAWSQVAGAGQTPYVATSTVIAPQTFTFGIPLADLGLSVGNTFNFDVWPTFGGGDSAYDALDNTSFAPPGYVPYGASKVPYDSATAAGSNYANTTFTVTTPTLTWNNATAASGFADGMTWDSNDTNQFNWNNGIFADYYVDGSNVIFDDTIGGTSVRNVTLNTVVHPGSIVVNNSGGNYTISGTGSIAGGAPFTKSGSSNLIINTPGTALGAVSITGGSVQLGASTGLATMTSLAISGNGTLDINNNHILINYGSGPDPIASIASLLSTGYNGGAWNGLGGIISSAVASNPGYGVGYADSADTGNPASLASGTIEVAFTLLGDANLDHSVNGVDFGILAANFNKGVTGWDKGDFNYDNSVNGVDFGELAANFNKGAAAASASDIAALDAFAAANGLLADVPEPVSAGLLLTAAAGVLIRRRRSR